MTRKNNKKAAAGRLAAYSRGLAAERTAALLLRLKGYKILARRYKTPVGEVDLVVRRGPVLAFVEVKARQRKEEALQALTPSMTMRISRAAHYFIAAHPQLAGLQIRFDLVVMASPWRWDHLDNAWRPPP